MKLPDGYFGKPYDNYYTLEHADTHGPRIDIGLGYGLILTMEPTAFRLDDRGLTLKVAGHRILLESQEVRFRYDSGNVTFEVCS